MPKTKSEEAKIDFSGNPLLSGKFPSLINWAILNISGLAAAREYNFM